VSPFLVFLRGGVRFAVELEQVRRVCTRSDLLSLSEPAPDLEGVIADGSHIVPVIVPPLPALLSATIPNRILLLHNAGHPFGFQVEGLEGPRSLVPRGTVIPLPARLEARVAQLPEDAILGVMTGESARGPSSEQGPVQPPGGSDVIFLLAPAPLFRRRRPREEGE